MAKGAYIGVNGVAKKIKKGYVGVSGVARKIKKAYIGIGGVARPCWSEGELAYYGRATDLYTMGSTYALYSTVLGSKALFYEVSYLSVYNASLTRSYVKQGNTPGPGASTTTYAVFERGAYIKAYNSSLTSFSGPSDSILGVSFYRRAAAGAGAGKYVLFAGGDYYDEPTSNVYVINDSLTASTATALSSARTGLGGASVGNYALFAGGETGTYVEPDEEESYWEYTPSSTVNAYNASLTRSTKTLSTALGGGWDVISASSKKYACFFYGTAGNVFDASLVRTALASLTTSRYVAAATFIDEFLVIGGGVKPNTAATGLESLEVYDGSFTKLTNGLSLYDGRYGLRAETVGNYALFAGGFENSSGIKVVDAFTVV